MASKDHPAERGLRAPLSPNEQTALLRIANGMIRPRDLKASDVSHLAALGLVRERDNTLELTHLGRKRVEALPSSVLGRQSMANFPDSAACPRTRDRRRAVARHI